MNNDKRVLAFISLGLLVAACLIPFNIVAFGHEELRQRHLAERARPQTNAEATNFFATTNGILYHPTNSLTEALPQIRLAPEDIVLPVKISTNKYCITEVFNLSSLKSDELRKFMMSHLDQEVGILVGSNFMVMLYTPPILNGEIVVDIPFSEADNARLFADVLGKK